MDDSIPLWRIIVIIALIIVEAVLVSAKKALQSVNENSIRKVGEEHKEKKKKAAQVLHLMEHESSYIDTAQFLVGSINIVIGVVFTGFLMEQSKVWMICLLTICLLLVVILFASVIPTKMTYIDSERIAINTCGILQTFHVIFFPFIYLLDKVSLFFFWILKISPEDLEDNVTEDEIISIVNEGFEQGVLEDNEVEMISNIIELDDKEVRDVMTNRRNVISISAEMTLGEALRFMLNERYSRFPLYEEERDNVVGVLHFKDVTQHYIAGEDGKVTLKEIARKPYFVPDTQSVDTLFDDMQLKKIHMAIAVDEYGQMAGVVALEDILEEIVGNILDEYDEDERMILKQGNNRYIMRGMAPLDEIEDTLGISMEQEDYDVGTLNGFLISFIGHLPGNDEKPVVHYEGYRFHVLDAKNNMIRSVRVVKEQEKSVEN
ncbi:MAG: hemolysin family protein [Acetivibrio sp.]